MSKPSKKRYRVLVADDHSVVREGLQLILREHFDIVGAVRDGRTLVLEAERLAPDLVVIDISMPILNGIEATRQLQERVPWIKIVVFTMHADVTYAAELLQAGASAYVLKNAPIEEIKTAMHRALAGEKYVTQQVAKEIRPFLQDRSREPSRPINCLTGREREVLQLLAEGCASKQIADVLCLSPRTVEFHKYKMMGKLGLRSTADLTRYAMKHGIVSI
jgi:DNA-binding NarL/FixJ family response regulator